MNNCFWKFSYLIKNLKLQAIKETSSLVHQLPPCPHATSHRTHITVWSAVVTSAQLVAVARFVFGLFVASVFFCLTFTQCALPTWQNWKNSPHFTNTLTRHSHGWCLYNTHTHSLHLLHINSTALGRRSFRCIRLLLQLVFGRSLACRVSCAISLSAL